MIPSPIRGRKERRTRGRNNNNSIKRRGERMKKAHNEVKGRFCPPGELAELQHGVSIRTEKDKMKKKEEKGKRKRMK